MFSFITFRNHNWIKLSHFYGISHFFIIKRFIRIKNISVKIGKIMAFRIAGVIFRIYVCITHFSLWKLISTRRLYFAKLWLSFLHFIIIYFGFTFKFMWRLVDIFSFLIDISQRFLTWYFLLIRSKQGIGVFLFLDKLIIFILFLKPLESDSLGRILDFFLRVILYLNPINSRCKFFKSAWESSNFF